MWHPALTWRQLFRSYEVRSLRPGSFFNNGFYQDPWIVANVAILPSMDSSPPVTYQKHFTVPTSHLYHQTKTSLAQAILFLVDRHVVRFVDHVSSSVFLGHWFQPPSLLLIVYSLQMNVFLCRGKSRLAKSVCNEIYQDLQSLLSSIATEKR